LPRLEVCVEDVAGLYEAIAGGADRIELCSALGLGGLTPSAGLMQAAAETGVPMAVMIRPRAGSFLYTPDEITVMKADIATARSLGLGAVVFGANRADYTLDTLALGDLAAASWGMEMVLHRAIDLCPDVETAVEEAIGLGFARILTSGGEVRAEDGIDRIARMIEIAAGRIAIMAGSGITVETWPAFEDLGLEEVHASCTQSAAGDPVLQVMGFEGAVLRQTDRARVAALKACILGI
jgi:copper homeostasis protein